MKPELLLDELREMTQTLNLRDEQLRDSEKRFRSFFEESILCMGIFNPKQEKFTEVNKSLCELLGYSKEELTSKTVYHFIDKRQREYALARVRRTNRGDPRSYTTNRRS